jgi:hypothetical protein
MKARLAKIFGAIAVMLIVLLLLGFLMPSSWSAESSLEIETDAADIFTYLNDLEKWDEWTIWSDINSEVTDPSHGEGATRQWDDENIGSGRILIVQSDPPETLKYLITNNSGARVSGEFLLTGLPKSTRITWTEKGDLGKNPLMGYLAKRIGASQAEQMDIGLEQLKARVFD